MEQRVKAKGLNPLFSAKSIAFEMLRTRCRACPQRALRCAVTGEALAASSRTERSTLGLWCRSAGEDPHLLKHGELIRNAPVLDHLAALEAADVDDVNLNMLARRRPTHN